MSSSPTSDPGGRNRVNDVIRTEKFVQLFNKKKKKSPEDLVTKIKEGISTLRHAEDPARLGKLKRGKHAGAYGYEVSRSSRILYQVQRTDAGCTVILLRVCNHKQVYGKD